MGGVAGGTYASRLLPGNIWDALLGANAPSAVNVFATMADIPAPAITLYSGNGTVGTTRVATLTDTLNFIPSATGGISVGAAFTTAHAFEVRAMSDVRYTVVKGFSAVAGYALDVRTSATSIAEFLNSGGVNLAHGVAAAPVNIGATTGTAKLTITGAGATSATVNQLWRDSATTRLMELNDLGHLGINAAPSAADRVYISSGSGKDGALNILASNVNNGGYGILVQGNAGAAIMYGVWSEITGGTSDGQAFRGLSQASGVNNNYGGYFSARNGTTSSIGAYCIVSGGDSVNSTDSAAVYSLNQSTQSTSRKSTWAVINSAVNNGTSYAGKFEVDANGTTAINYGVHSRAYGSLASATNIAGYFQANGGLGATNYAIITDGGNIGFGTATPSVQALLELSSTTQAFLIMRMTAAQASAITPANGMQLYATDTDATFTSAGFWSYQAGAWVKSISTASTLSSVLAAGNTSGANDLIIDAAQNLFTPSIVGGTAVGSFIDHKSTTAAGTTTGLAYRINGGNNGATNIVNIYNDGQYLIGTTTRNPTALGTVRIGQGTSLVDIGEIVAGSGCIWLGQATPSTTNFAERSVSSTENRFNAASTVGISTGGSARITVTSGLANFTPAATSSGVVSSFLYTAPASTGQTAGTESISVSWAMAVAMQHASNTAITTQRDFVISNRTHSFASATGTISDAVAFEVSGAPVAGTNAIITRSWAARFIGNVAVSTALYIGSSTVAPSAYLEIRAGSAAAGGAPFKLAAGTNNTTAETGAMEYDGTNLFFTRTGTTRQTVLTANVVTTEVVVSDTTVTVNVAGTDYKLLARA